MSKRTFLALALAFLFGIAPAAFAQPTPPQAGESRAEPETQGEVPEAGGRPKPANPHASQAALIALPPPSADEAAQLKPPIKGAPEQVAFGRDLPAAATEAGLHGLLSWESLPGGTIVAAVRVNSPGASALRLGLRIVALPPAAVLRFRAAEGEEMFEVSGEEILDTIALNVEAGDNPAQAHIYWSPVIEADNVVAEFELPAGSRPQDLHIAIPHVSHFVTSAREGFVQKASSTCQLDVTCYSAWSNESNAVARMLFQIGTSGYLCSGTLIADQDTSTTTPYFLSANHCVGDQTTASTLQTYWFYRSSSCNSGTAGAYQTITGGATLLYATTNTDTSFMRLANLPPAGAVYAGWSVGSTSPLNTSLTGIHHPKGDLQKISFGSLYQYATCTPPSGGSFQCSGASTGSATFLGILWNQGLTEPGSSGSGIFLNSGHYIVGQLYGGSSACGSSNGPDFYGRFDVAYNASLSQWLASSARTLTVSKTGSGTGTVTSSPSGISCGGTCAANFSSGASVTLTATPSGTSTFTGWSGACSGTGSCSVIMSANNSVTASFNDPALTPGAPQNLAAAPGSAQATFTFSPPSNTGGSAIVRYNVTCNPGGIIASASASPITMTGLQNGTAYTCSATATNATTTGPASGSVTVTPGNAPLALIAVVSRKNQPTTAYDLPIDTTKPVSGAITVEPRTDNNHRVIFRFNSPITTAGVPSVTDVNGAAINAAMNIALSGSDVIVTLTGVDGRRARVALGGVNGTLDVAAAIGFLAGDENGNGNVTASDILRARGRVGQAVGGTTYPYDVDLSGNLTNNDVEAVKAHAGNSLQ